MKTTLHFAIAWLLLLGVGCQELINATNTRARIDADGPYYAVNVNAFSAASSRKYTTFVLLPMDEGVGPTDLEFLEYSGYVGTILSSRGLRRVAKPEAADLAVFVAYGIGEPKEQIYSRAVPVWGQTGVSSITTNTYGSTSHSTVHPSYGVTGYRTKVESTTTYARWAILQAVDVAAWRDQQTWMEIWKAKLTSVGTTGDLRRVIPVLFAASIDLLGTNTAHSVERTIAENGSSVRWLRQNTAARN